jgi:hypothetical protein
MKFTQLKSGTLYTDRVFTLKFLDFETLFPDGVEQLNAKFSQHRYDAQTSSYVPTGDIHWFSEEELSDFAPLH